MPEKREDGTCQSDFAGVCNAPVVTLRVAFQGLGALGFVKDGAVVLWQRAFRTRQFKVLLLAVLLFYQATRVCWDIDIGLTCTHKMTKLKYDV